MPYSNISAEITAADKAAIIQHINDITALLPFLINLTPEEKQALPKISNKRLSFVTKGIEYANINPTLVPSFLSFSEGNADFILNNDTRQIFESLAQLVESVDDTRMAAGSEAYNFALAFYANVQEAAKRNVPGTSVIAQDLAELFAGHTTPPTITSIIAVTRQTTLTPITVDYISRNAGGGEQVNNDWGDGYESPLTMLSGVYVSVTHTYLVIGDYIINITDLPGGTPGGVAAIGEIRFISCKLISLTIPPNAWLRNITIPDNQIVTMTIPATCNGLMIFDGSGNNFDLDTVHGILTTINSFGTSNGIIKLEGGTNAAPVLGFPALAQLIARGWTVTTN